MRKYPPKGKGVHQGGCVKTTWCGNKFSLSFWVPQYCCFSLHCFKFAGPIFVKKKNAGPTRPQPATAPGKPTQLFSRFLEWGSTITFFFFLCSAFPSNSCGALWLWRIVAGNQVGPRCASPNGEKEFHFIFKKEREWNPSQTTPILHVLDEILAMPNLCSMNPRQLKYCP